jgi:hypothetical protein
MDCENTAEYFELKSGLDEKIKLTKSMIDLATGSLGTILFIDTKNITKGIQKKKK